MQRFFSRSARRLQFSRLWLLGGAVITLTASTVWITYAQQPQPVRIEPAWFTGKAFRGDNKDLTAGRVIFEKGAYTKWHSHPNGQLIMVEKGIGRTQRKGGPVLELEPGDAVFAPPNVLHWHGAAPNSEMTHVTVNFGGTTDWKEAVSPKEYAGKAVKVTPR